MKKIYYMLVAAALSIVATTGCTREEIFDNDSQTKPLRTFTCSFEAADADTKTDITKQGKTVWAEGDKLWVSNGSECDTITVASEYANQKYCEFQTTLAGKVYVVYPLAAAKGMTADNKLKIDIPSVQDGTFGSANISVAVAEDRYVKMKNVTSVLKFRIPATAKPIKVVSVNTAASECTGSFVVDVTGTAPKVEKAAGAEYASDFIIKTDGLSGNFYATVIPGTYAAGFSMTAVSIDLANAYETRTTVSEKTLGVNELFDLGKIGDDLKGLQGDGSAASPWQISSLPEMLAFTYYVNAGNSMMDQHAKLMNDISTVTIPVGTEYVSYQGEFDGNDKTITLNLSETEKKPIGLFPSLKDSAYVHNLKVAGKVTSEGGTMVGAIAGSIDDQTADAFGIRLKDCSSSATVTGDSKVAGLVGYVNTKKSYVVSFENCSNSGAISANHTAAGILSYSYQSKIYGCSNSGAVTTIATNGNVAVAATDLKGTGGIVGYAQNSSVDNCTNAAQITAYNKGGGIAGHLYWATIKNCQNSGKVASDTLGVIGGIVGGVYVQSSILNCINTGEIVSTNGVSSVGGILGCGLTVNYGSGSRVVALKQCVNKGAINVESPNGTTIGVGGIIGYGYLANNTTANRVEMYYCTNEADINVKGTAYQVAGVAGRIYDYWSWTTGIFRGCSNKGNVTAEGSQYVAGVIGGYQPRSGSGRSDVDNCENHGNIIGHDRVGGILGGTLAGMTNAGCGVRITNALNTGSIAYTDATHTSPRVGGISGQHYGGRLYNCYNSGKIGLKEGTAAAGAEAYIGAISGYTNLAGGYYYSYYLEGTAPTITGSGSATKPTDAVCSAVSADGVLARNVEINSVSYSDVVSVLNAPLATNIVYYTWTAGPKFHFTGDINIGDGFDLGNGGNI